MTKAQLSMLAPLPPKPRKAARVLMQIIDCGQFPDGRTCGHFQCRKCQRDEWLAASLTDLRRGLPCPVCNPELYA